MITDEQKDLLLQQYYDRGILKKEIRSYEVSLWTLQDEFLTVLKWSDVEQKGRIEKPKMTLNIDGTEKFNFSIPMYYQLDGELIPNPSWYSVDQNMIIEGLRKVKVIFNKGETEERVFEFLIIHVTENHENDILTCDVETEGLAFQELGKIGYKLNLSQDNFELDYTEWQADGTWQDWQGNSRIDEPIQSLDYWCQEGCHLEPWNGSTFSSSRIWYYTVQMNWKSFEEGTISNGRASAKIYEDSYPATWDNDLNPTSYIKYREKARPISAEKSNLYNITQTIAEQFGVFCRYEYHHNSNYQIDGKLIVFYNNFFEEDKGNLSLTYPYATSKVERSLDSTDITTKLYVLDVNNDTTLEGVNSIMNAQANSSKEDYILNFDYLYKHGSITKEQYDGIKPYKKAMRAANITLTKLQNQVATYQVQLPEEEAKKKILENSINLDQEQIKQNSALLNALDARDGRTDGYIELSAANADYCVILTDKDSSKYVNLKTTNKGIEPNSIKVYTTLSGSDLSGPITSFKLEYDEHGNLTILRFTTSLDEQLQKVFLTYKYDPQLYYQKIVDTWTRKLYQDTEELKAIQQRIGPKTSNEVGYDLSIYPSGTTIAEAYAQGLNGKLNNTLDAIDAALAEKEVARQKFERLMGPALREGYWQPEDYTDYGDRYTVTAPFTFNSIDQNKQDILQDTGHGAIVAWDRTLFDEEQKLYYEEGVEKIKKYYPCIDLTTIFPNGIPIDLDQYSFVWKSAKVSGNVYDNAMAIKNLRTFAVGSQAVVCFLRTGSISAGYTAKPVLLLIGAKSLSDDELTQMMTYSTSTSGKAVLEKYSVNVDSNGGATVSHSNYHRIETASVNAWITLDDSSILIYPRVKFSSLDLKTNSSDLVLKYNGEFLSLGEDYYVQTRETKRSNVYYLEYYVTIKPYSLIKKSYAAANEIEVNYVISNANTSIYLDALKVSKENAQPKVSYSLTPNILDTTITHTLYNELARIVMINDVDLKFENVFGYISGLDLDLDAPWNDSIEVKNYTTKFEDLFSTIVAQTEEMRRNGDRISAAMGGGIPLSESGLESTLSNQDLVFQAYLDSYFDSSEVVANRLRELFTEASEILAASKNSLQQMNALTLDNASILSGFASNIAEELSVKVERQATRPSSFKVGDIWIQPGPNNTEYRWVATTSSENITGNVTGHDGYVLTYDGTLAQITGAALNVNAENGIIDVTAANEINITSGNTVDIKAGEDVNIIGNRSVNIGGTQINIGSTSSTTEDWGGINLVASSYDDIDTTATLSKVLINPKRIEMGSSNIIMRGANKIQMVTSLGNISNTSAISLSPDGVWIGSGNGIRLYSGNINLTQANDGTFAVSNGLGANVELLPTHLLFGVSNTNGNTTAIEMTDDYIVLGAGNIINGNNASTTIATGITGTSSGLMGAKFTRESIGLAVQTGSGANTITTAMLMDANGFTVGSAGIDVTTADLRTASDATNPTITNGSYTRISKEGIELGSFADLYINTDNFKLQTHSRDKNTNNDFTEGETIMALGHGLQNIGYNSTMAQVKAANASNETTIRLLVNKNGLYVNGDVYASTFIATSTRGQFIADGTSFGLYDTNKNAILTINANGYIEAKKRLVISSDNLYIGTSSYSALADAQIVEIVKLYQVASQKPAATSGTWTTTIPTLAAGNRLWSMIRTQKQNDEYSYSAVTEETGYMGVSEAGLLATSISNGTTSVPYVSTTGITIQNGSMTVSGTSQVNILGNAQVLIGSSSSNSAVILNSDGISIGSKGGIGIASGATIDINSTNFIVRSKPQGAQNMFHVGSSSKYINYGPPAVADWESGKHYEVNDRVKIGDTTANKVYYKCTTANSDTTFTASKWTEYTPTFELSVQGAITATAFTINGNQPFNSSGKINASQIDDLPEFDITKYKKITVTSTGLSWGDTLGTGQAGLVVGSQGSMQIASEGSLIIAAGGSISIQSKGAFSLTSSNAIINPQATGASSIFRIGFLGTATPEFKEADEYPAKAYVKIKYIEDGTTKYHYYRLINAHTANTAWDDNNATLVDTSEEPYIRYSETGGLQINGSGTFNGKITADSGNIGGWTIGTNRIYNNIDFTNTNSGNSTGVGLLTNQNLTIDGTTQTKTVAFWAGNGNFLVTSDGYVFAKKIIIDGKTIDLAG